MAAHTQAGGVDEAGAANHGRLVQAGRATAAEVMEQLDGTPGNSTVRTQLRVLERKGHVKHEEEGLRYVYMPTVPGIRRGARR